MGDPVENGGTEGGAEPGAAGAARPRRKYAKQHRYPLTLDYLPEKIAVRRPQLTSENRFITTLIANALEAGLSHSDAVRLSIGVYKEVDVIARNENADMLGRSALKIIRMYCAGIMRSGSTFSSFEIATRAVAAWRLTAIELKKLHAEWDKETVTRRLKLRRVRQEAAGKIPRPVDRAILTAEERDRELDLDDEEVAAIGEGEWGGVAGEGDIDGFGDLYEDFEELRRLDRQVHGINNVDDLL